MATFQLREIAEIIQQPIKRDRLITGFQQDQRLLFPGHLFFAIKGEKVDGHTFLSEAAQKGAVAAVVSQNYSGGDHGLELIKVENVLFALHAIAQAIHRQRSMKIIGVTGSVGKTTTKEFIATLLEESFRVGKTPGNANSQVGLPLSLLNADGNEEVFVAEMGMSQPGELTRLVQIAPPEISVLTNVSLAHVSYFQEGIEGIAKAKSEIFSSSLTRVGVVSSQAFFFESVQRAMGCEPIVYGLKEGDYYLNGCSVMERGTASPKIDLPFEASHLRENFVAAAIVARLMGMDWPTIRTQAMKLTTISGRFQQLVHEGITVVNDSYNANAISMKAALLNLPQPPAGKRTIGVLGAMRELGDYSVSCHEEVAQIALDTVDDLLCLGDECQPMIDLFHKNNRHAELYMDLQLLKKRLFEMAQPGDVVLLKGSNSNQLWKVLS